jgi:hypothetical protein
MHGCTLVEKQWREENESNGIRHYQIKGEQALDMLIAMSKF